MSSSYCATVADRKTSAVVGGEVLFSLAQCCYCCSSTFGVAVDCAGSVFGCCTPVVDVAAC